MGNHFAICITCRFSCMEATITRHKKVLKVATTDGKILEFRAPILVNDLLVNFPTFGVALSKESPQHLPLNYELKIGEIYYLIPISSSTKTKTTSKADGARQDGGGIKRIKVIITKQQLQELLSKRISVEEMLSGIEKKSCSSSPIVSSVNWKPKLESIPEGSE